MSAVTSYVQVQLAARIRSRTTTNPYGPGSNLNCYSRARIVAPETSFSLFPFFFTLVRAACVAGERFGFHFSNDVKKREKEKKR